MAETAGLLDEPLVRYTFRGREAVDDRLRTTLRDHGWIAGDAFSSADLLFAGLGFASRELLPTGDLVDRWLSRCTERPSFARALARDTPPRTEVEQ